jgi:hypothetical protein
MNITFHYEENTMTLSQVSARFASLGAAVLASAVLLSAAPYAHAASETAAYYQVSIADTAKTDKAILRGVFVKCDGGACVAPIASSAPKNMCVSIARKFGEVKSFTAGKRVFDAAELAQCNASNKVNIAKK